MWARLRTCVALGRVVYCLTFRDAVTNKWNFPIWARKWWIQTQACRRSLLVHSPVELTLALSDWLLLLLLGWHPWPDDASAQQTRPAAVRTRRKTSIKTSCVDSALVKLPGPTYTVNKHRPQFAYRGTEPSISCAASTLCSPVSAWANGEGWYASLPEESIPTSCFDL